MSRHATCLPAFSQFFPVHQQGRKQLPPGRASGRKEPAPGAKRAANRGLQACSFQQSWEPPYAHAQQALSADQSHV